MPTVATLIANPQAPVLTQEIASKVSALVGSSQIGWLAGGIACDIALPQETNTVEAENALRAGLSGLPIDIAIQNSDLRRKSILLADMDSTMIGQECIDELAAEVGLKGKVAEITARAMNGEIEFEPALRERVALLKGLPVSVIDQVIKTRISLAPGGLELVRTMKKHGAHTVLVSGGFTLFTSRIAAMIGFDENHANELLFDDGYLSGKVAEPILGRDAKVAALRNTAARLGRSISESIVVGDGANDLGMIELAGTGVALHAKPAVAAQARIRIDYGDLTSLLYIQGYRQSDIVN
jgi:phosphoserine phosphatase